MNRTSYYIAVETARRYLRKKDFLTYGSQLVPERVGSETWSLSWAYMRNIDNIIDKPSITRDQGLTILEGEREAEAAALNGNYVIKDWEPLRRLWLYYFAENVRKYYDERVIRVVWRLYKSAVDDMRRKFKILSRDEMKKLLYNKAVCFFKLYFLLSKFELNKLIDPLSDALGLALGLLDDFVDFIDDLRSGYVNLLLENNSHIRGTHLRNVISEVLKSEYRRRISKQILLLLLKARQIGYTINNSVVRNLVLRLTEVFAAPIIEGRFIPGEKYFFKGGKILARILPRNEYAAYKIGHRLIALILQFPQLPGKMIHRYLT